MTGAAVHLKLKYVVEDRDRHGNMRVYVRVPGRKKVRITAQPGTDAFMEAYKDALAGKNNPPRLQRAASGSFGWLCQLYYGSAAYTGGDVSTRKWKRRALDSICVKYGTNPIKLMEPRHVRKIRDERKDKKAAANQRLKALRSLFAWGCEEGHAPHDPTIGVKGISYVAQGHHTWTPSEIKQYEARHPLGTKARLAKDLLQYTTGRREDAPRFGPQHVQNNRIKFRQAKNEHRHPIDIDLPLHPKLAASIKAFERACKSKHLTFLTTEYGKPYTTAGFGNAMRDWCDQANLHHCSAHGLRKATPTEIAQRGGSAHEIMSVTGHRTMQEADKYVRDVRMARLADRAMRKVK